MAAEADVPRWLYAVGAVGVFVVLAAAPELLDKSSKPVSDHIVDGISDMQSTTTTTTTTTTLPGG